jgi:hypothetical protein
MTSSLTALRFFDALVVGGTTLGTETIELGSSGGRGGGAVVAVKK